MHYYQFNIGDYKTHTAHLTPVEDICYRRLLDHYYLHEKPIFNDIEKITRLLMLNGYSTDVEHVLNEYFKLVEQHWHNVRADEEIAVYHAQKESKSKAGKASAAKRFKPIEQVFNGCSTNVELNKKQETRNNTKGSRLTKDWLLPDEWIFEARKINNALTNEKIKFIADGFKDYWIGVAGAKGVKLDWLATWRNWIRNQKIEKQDSEQDTIKRITKDFI
jgi:uncharacterized protein YdaU (DUF1376 family)